MWEYDPYHNSIITAGNGGIQPTQAAFTIFYNQGTQRYDLKQTLQPDEQMWIDVGKLIREHVRDKNGKVLPESLTSGSYEIRDLTHNGIGTLFEGKVIYDKTYGHVAYGCGVCCGYKTPSTLTWYNPLGLPVPGTGDDGVNATDSCSLQNVDVSDSFYGGWSTANTSIATVDYYGTHSGVAAGSTTSSTWGDLQVFYRTWSCPINTLGPGGASNVQKPGYLKVVSSSTTSACQGLSCKALLQYRVLDTNGTPMSIAGMTITESVSRDNGTCNSTIDDSSSWSTDSTGTMIGLDGISTCHSNPSPRKSFICNTYGPPRKC